ncbi:MAG: UTP--glucose-1-phosphate uridylyltransferase [Bacteroidota bacterium]|nr:UTP--glucose-1-phosphate uridylyltransferase [Bacteroidota bacterium]
MKRTSMTQQENEFETRFAPFRERMERSGAPPLAIYSFRRSYAALCYGTAGPIPSSRIRPVVALPSLEDITAYADRGRKLLERVVIVKLNGGLGTGMGLECAKSLIEVKNGLTFIDIVALQCRALRERSGIAIPLVFMNSFRTDAETLKALEQYGDVAGDFPLSFLQHRVPKVSARDLTPAINPADPALEWCPPGHGDFFTAVQTSGLLEIWLGHGYRYLFVSNVDNLGAVFDPSIVGYMDQEGIEFLMEVTDRTEADRKGGHIAVAEDERLLLREAAQCPPEERCEFEDIERFKYFNTNNIWIDLAALRSLLASHGGILPLPVMANRKTLDPRDPASAEVYQLETAVGAAITLFDRAAALRVPRMRFAPVKTTDDLVAVRSDAYLLTEDFRIILHPDRKLRAPIVHLDPVHYRFLEQIREHFPDGPPSLLRCTSLRVEGDVVFGGNVRIVGTVHLRAPEGERLVIPGGTVLEQ